MNTVIKELKNQIADTKPLLLRVEDAAKVLSLSRSTVYEMLAKGELPSVKYRSARRVPLAALEKWVVDNTTEAWV